MQNRIIVLKKGMDKKEAVDRSFCCWGPAAILIL